MPSSSFKVMWYKDREIRLEPKGQYLHEGKRLGWKEMFHVIQAWQAEEERKRQIRLAEMDRRDNRPKLGPDFEKMKIWFNFRKTLIPKDYTADEFFDTLQYRYHDDEEYCSVENHTKYLETLQRLYLKKGDLKRGGRVLKFSSAVYFGDVCDDDDDVFLEWEKFFKHISTGLFEDESEQPAKELNVKNEVRLGNDYGYRLLIGMGWRSGPLKDGGLSEPLLSNRWIGRHGISTGEDKPYRKRGKIRFEPGEVLPGTITIPISFPDDDLRDVEISITRDTELLVTKLTFSGIIFGRQLTVSFVGDHLPLVLRQSDNRNIVITFLLLLPFILSKLDRGPRSFFVDYRNVLRRLRIKQVVRRIVDSDWRYGLGCDLDEEHNRKYLVLNSDFLSFKEIDSKFYVLVERKFVADFLRYQHSVDYLDDAENIESRFRMVLHESCCSMIDYGILGDDGYDFVRKYNNARFMVRSSSLVTVETFGHGFGWRESFFEIGEKAYSIGCGVCRYFVLDDSTIGDIQFQFDMYRAHFRLYDFLKIFPQLRRTDLFFLIYCFFLLLPDLFFKYRGIIQEIDGVMNFDRIWNL